MLHGNPFNWLGEEMEKFVCESVCVASHDYDVKKT